MWILGIPASVLGEYASSSAISFSFALLSSLSEFSGGKSFPEWLKITCSGLSSLLVAFLAFSELIFASSLSFASYFRMDCDCEGFSDFSRS